MFNKVINFFAELFKNKVMDASVLKKLNIENLTKEEVRVLEQKALSELVERWGPDRIYKVEITPSGYMNVTGSEFMFFAWDSDEEWVGEVWGTAKSNLEDSFDKSSEFFGCDQSFGYSRSIEVEYFNNK